MTWHNIIYVHFFSNWHIYIEIKEKFSCKMQQQVPRLLFHMKWRVRGGLNSSPCSPALRDKTWAPSKTSKHAVCAPSTSLLGIVHLRSIPAQVICFTGQQSTHISRPLKLFTTTHFSECLYLTCLNNMPWASFFLFFLAIKNICWSGWDTDTDAENLCSE